MPARYAYMLVYSQHQEYIEYATYEKSANVCTIIYVKHIYSYIV